MRGRAAQLPMLDYGWLPNEVLSCETPVYRVRVSGLIQLAGSSFRSHDWPARRAIL